MRLMTDWYGIGAPAGTPARTIDTLRQRFTAKLFPDDDLLGRIDAVDLEHVL